MNLPLSKKLPRQEFVSLAELQDRFIDAIYSFDKNLILHGGTAIWRCYSGNRFSYDIDAYVRSNSELNLISRELTWALSKNGANLDKVRRIGKSMIAQISNPDAQLKAELGIKKAQRSIIKEYERADGTFVNVLTLTPEDFILEKIAAYSGRRYIRDLYDIYHLMNYVTRKKAIHKALFKFMREIERPVNLNELPIVVYSGISPTYQGMLDYIMRRLE
ncbi:MAG: nucleotidyl transferase AbiEii/AbiGii toxin family protein [Candidatus Micrarchaeota archaeon]|nr:nucleotidyl transferase AbiEii/AbiGii toxin family protein [Candidatus Micrarchaeota archaeon]MDE1848273.1 nucleotidyl transferase AbiEii/AbiGii toxin family protein [Candidatus Micrarchaeota archaeon]MDE1864590.1 nucleotidyl transferase AbiEii/AbiGii toxin family protein [Candidatus Micrarchaeota archaeon]